MTIILSQECQKLINRRLPKLALLGIPEVLIDIHAFRGTVSPLYDQNYVHTSPLFATTKRQLVICKTNKITDLALDASRQSERYFTE